MLIRKANNKDTTLIIGFFQLCVLVNLSELEITQI